MGIFSKMLMSDDYRCLWWEVVRAKGREMKIGRRGKLVGGGYREGKGSGLGLGLIVGKRRGKGVPSPPLLIRKYSWHLTIYGS